MPVLEIKNLNKSFTGNDSIHTSVLKKVYLEVSENELVSVIGASGSGKSTLLDCIAGLTSPDSGEILLNGKSINGSIGKVSYMMQDDVLLPWRTLKENVELPLDIADGKTTKSDKKIRELASIFGLSKYLNFYPKALSGGTKQRASLLRSYSQQKELMLLDEPFGKLDALLKINLEEWFLRIWQKNMLSVIMVTHDIEEAIFLSNRIYIISRGKVTGALNVPFKRPRSNSLLISPEFTALKNRLLREFRLVS